MTTTWTDERPRSRQGSVPEAPARTIPFDYSFHFRLEGVPQRTSRETVSVSIEAAFTAVSIGYGLVPVIETFEFGPQARLPVTGTTALAATAAAPVNAPSAVPASALATLSASFGTVPTPGSTLTPGGIGPASTLRNIRFDDILDALEGQVVRSSRVSRDEPAIETALRAGIRINPRLLGAALLGGARGRLDAASLRELFQVVLPPPAEVPFLYALFDEGSGREFQSEPVLSIAGLGGPDGRRPFRHFAQPVAFAPRTTIRMDVTELSDVRGDLYVSLHGFKVLGAPGAGEARDATRGGRRRRR